MAERVDNAFRSAGHVPGSHERHSRLGSGETKRRPGISACELERWGIFQRLQRAVSCVAPAEIYMKSTGVLLTGARCFYSKFSYGVTRQDLGFMFPAQ